VPLAGGPRVLEGGVGHVGLQPKLLVLALQDGRGRAGTGVHGCGL
jgi:hypothetical protein